MSSPHVLVLGANGMLGHAVVRTLAARAGWVVHGTQVEDRAAPFYLNACDGPQRWTPLLRSFPYEYIVNCIGILKAAMDERSAASLRQAILVNSVFPHELAEAAQQIGARVIHMSTDGVFSGASNRPYVETDATDATDAYGKTKALGESPAPNVLNIRCSIVGRDPVWRKGLVEWLLAAAPGAEISGFTDQVWNGVTTVQFAALCRRIIDSGSWDRIRGASGVHHFCPNPPLTKYELLCLVRDAAGHAVNIRQARSGAAHSRTLGSGFSELTRVYPGGGSWNRVLEQALAGEPEAD